ncbi:MAG: hypothetical protein KDJ28_17630 [Candidatus Competibacteraceae bacterium]|nr:hypothetical protein [Candidatus Competibacteraceae bacterium]
MSYSDFTLEKIQQSFALKMVEDQDLFSSILEIEISNILKQNLELKVPLALAINTEKARSEFIIAEVLVELKRILNGKISLFSGINLDVDKEKGLNGYCDFIVSQSSEQFFLKAPIITIVEAKNENIPSGIGQCIAEMIAARLFNEQAAQPIERLYGAVTIGNIWKFLKYEQGAVYIDQQEYHISQVNKIVGILVAMATETA